MFKHVDYLQFQAKPEKPDALLAAKMQELVGGQFGEMTVMMQYLWQGWSCRVPGKYKDMIMDIATEEIGHVEMLTTMLARLLEGAPNEATEKAAAANPVLAAVLGGMNPQHAIVTGGGALPRDAAGRAVEHRLHHRQRQPAHRLPVQRGRRGAEPADDQPGLQHDRRPRRQGHARSSTWPATRTTSSSGCSASSSSSRTGWPRARSSTPTASTRTRRPRTTFYSFDPASTRRRGPLGAGPDADRDERDRVRGRAQPLTDDQPLGPRPGPEAVRHLRRRDGQGQAGHRRRRATPRASPTWSTRSRARSTERKSG